MYYMGLCLFAMITLWFRGFTVGTKLGVGIVLITSYLTSCLLPVMGEVNLPIYVQFFAAASPVVVCLAAVALPFVKISPRRVKEIQFDCPFCEQPISFERYLLGRAQACPLCTEIVTVSTDPDVHTQAREAHLRLVEVAAAATQSHEEIDLDGAHEVAVDVYRDPMLEFGGRRMLASSRAEELLPPDPVESD